MILISPSTPICELKMTSAKPLNVFRLTDIKGCKFAESPLSVANISPGPSIEKTNQKCSNSKT